jgi:hypothetical protein
MGSSLLRRSATKRQNGWTVRTSLGAACLFRGPYFGGEAIAAQLVAGGVGSDFLCGSRDTDQVPLGVGEMADDQRGVGCPFRTNRPESAESLSLAQRRLNVRHAHVEQNAARIAGAAADPTRDAGAIGILDESVVAHFRNGLDLVSNSQPNNSP